MPGLSATGVPILVFVLNPGQFGHPGSSLYFQSSWTLNLLSWASNVW